LVFFLFCVAVPLAAVFARLRAAPTLFDTEILRVARLTAGQAALSAALAASIGLPLGLWVGRRAGRARLWAEGALALPFGVPAVCAGLAWVILLGRSGVLGGRLDWLYSFKAVILAHVVFNAPWIALLVSQARAGVPEAEREAARSLGAGPFLVFRSVTWPRVRDSFLSGSAQAFVFCAMSFVLILELGGGPPVQTLETALFSRLRFGVVDLSGAAVCAFWQLLITLLPWFFVVYIERKRVSGGGRRNLPAEGNWGPLKILAASAFFLPYLLIFRGVQRTGFSPEILPALKISLLLALGTSLGTVLTALAATATAATSGPRWRRALSFVFGVPSGISALVIGLGFWLAYSRVIDPFEGSALAMVAIQVTLFFSIAYRIFWPVAEHPETALLEAASSLGATPARAFLAVEWPRWRKPILSAFAMVAGASLGEVAAVSLFYSEKLIPLPLLLSRWTTQYRFDDAQALAAFLLVLTAGVTALVWGRFAEN
jgi:thiamine transport system permease protein